MNRFKMILAATLTIVSAQVFSQEEKEDLINWQNQDYTSDFRGTNVEKAYAELLANKQPKANILVAVIDSGIDIDHEDLKDIIWTNENEIPNNGIDDDKNGYIDDVHGWNFLGNANGDLVGKDNLEVTREYKRLEPKWGSITTATEAKANLEEWKYFQKVKNEYEEGRMKADGLKRQLAEFEALYNGTKATLTAELGEDFTIEEVKSLESEDSNVAQAKNIMLNLNSNGVNDKYVESFKDYVVGQSEWYYNTDVDVRRDIIKDDPNNIYERGYGNNNVKGTDPDHGTHVAGIIGAIRNNDIGMNGVANNITIMPVRTVPGGDEHDKDVANAIRYAVDNGARVVNMSFGKSFSPNAKVVSEAIQYAEDKNVLLIHAAGNDGKDVDVNNNFPTDDSEFIRGKIKTYITVGASSHNADKDFPASFTNYGEKGVDLFAPGVDIYSTTPGSEYGSNSGTSMAAPFVSGVAALVLSYYPDIKAKNLKKILEKSVTELEYAKVYLPGSGGADEDGKELPKKEVDFERLSVTGGLINAYTALEMADKKSKY